MNNFFNPEFMYKFNAWMVVLNVVLVIIFKLLGLTFVFTQIFVASGFCFGVGAVANWAILRMKEKSKRNK